jgi:calcineurin-like phosphoesterase family protein
VCSSDLEICIGLNISKDRIILVPGNHDINWILAKDNMKNRFDNFLVFLFSFYGEELFRKMYPKITWNLQIGSSRPEPSDIFAVCHNEDLNFTIIGLNSCIYENDQHHYGFVGGKQLRAIQDVLNEKSAQNQGIRVALLHHHLHPFPEQIKMRENSEIWQDFSTIRDSGLTERWFEKMHFDIILHGHKHKPLIRETAIRDKSEGSKSCPRLIACGAGSAGVVVDELEHEVGNQYEIIEFLRSPRKVGVDFLQIEWRELALTPDAEWATSNKLNIVG